MSTHSNNIKRFTYYNIIDFPEEKEDRAPTKSIPKNLLQDFLKVLGKEIMKEDRPKLEEIEQELQSLKKEKETNQGELDNNQYPITESSIIAQLQQMGYIKDSRKWLSKKGFFAV
ncbi:MAG TPA: hypothetical protein VH797_09650, partial [Nitrososphaeraceae archaeon]